MISASFDGYVTEQPMLKDGQYGRYVDVSIRVATAGKEVHYVTSRFYGRKVNPVLEFINNGDYITMSGCVTSIKERIKEGTVAGKYCQIYIKDACYTLPPKLGGESRFKANLPAAASPNQVFDDLGLSEYNGEPF